MARKPHTLLSDLDVRQATLEHLAAKHARYDGRGDVSADGMRRYYERPMLALRAGASVRLMRWQYPRSVRDLLPAGGPNDWLELTAEDSVRRVSGPMR